MIKTRDLPHSSSSLAPDTFCFCLFVWAKDREKKAEKGFLFKPSQESHAFHALAKTKQNKFVQKLVAFKKKKINVYVKIKPKYAESVETEIFFSRK